VWLEIDWRWERSPRPVMTLNCSVHYVISLLQGHAAVKIPSYEKPIKGIVVYTTCMHVTSCECLAWETDYLCLQRSRLETVEEEEEDNPV